MATSNKPRDEFIEANGLRFHYREWGDTRTKHAVVLLHGYAETSEMWTESAQDLAREFRVIAVDQRGYGQSDRAGDQDYTRATQVEDLEAVLDQLGLRSVTLVGHSMGGANAICYAAEHPEVVSALIVIEAAPEVLRSGVEGLRRMMASAEEFTSMEEATDAFRPFFPYATTEQLDRRARAALTEGAGGALTWDFDPIFRDPMARPPEPDPGQRRLADLWDCVDRVQCPTMIVRGAETDMLTPEAIQRLHRRIPGSRVSLIEDAGHPVPTDQPSSLSLNVREFLQSLANLPA
ncbi:MAG: alpha/beta fold hydrolase [Dehalococcoidia bacterium]|nr:alpha/beta fold hydrolase [Dehalococcoidia bacterium]